jgi:hypothetical protein
MQLLLIAATALVIILIVIPLVRWLGRRRYRETDKIMDDLRRRNGK